MLQWILWIRYIHWIQRILLHLGKTPVCQTASNFQAVLHMREREFCTSIVCLGVRWDILYKYLW